MKATMTCAVAAVGLTGCLGMMMGKGAEKLPTSKVSFQVPVANADGRLTAYKVIGSVGEDQASNPGIRVRRTSLDELRTWQRIIELGSITPTQACFVWTDYQHTGDTYGDGVRMPPPTYADYQTATVALDTGSGGHYTGTAKLDRTPLTFQFDSYVTDSGYPHWVPAVSHWEKILYEACFETTAPLAQEKSARWTIKGSNWEAAFDFELGAGPSGPAAAARPASFVGRWSGVVAMTMVAGKSSDGGSTSMTIAIDELPDDTLELRFEGGEMNCGIKAKVSGRRASIPTGQICTIASGNRHFKLRTSATELALTETGLALSLELQTTKKSAGRTEHGKITLTGELAAR